MPPAVARTRAAHKALPRLDGRRERAAAPGALVAGIDEAGRGPLAGPVVCAAVVFHGPVPRGLADSKKLAPERREELYGTILARAHVAVASASPAEIDRRNIRGATLAAMCRALLGLPCAPDLALVDGRDVPPGLSCEGRAVIGGDGEVAAIAAASIVAKVTRDRMMARLDAVHPAYGFARHMGYGTPEHLAALAAHGPCPAHRRSFAPVRAHLGDAERAALESAHAKEAGDEAGLLLRHAS
ncbi:ribonuclease HII [Salinarimonas rosea]|uniref:ribonuclease HII n=1 Tax=Salinarimonas rosea TaxID=552063 RepID=UPI0004051F37|nr:ribonuclease HII [Salinarimonas rosea]